MGRFGQTGITVVRPGGVVTSLPGWPGKDIFLAEDWILAGASSGVFSQPVYPHGNPSFGQFNWWLTGSALTAGSGGGGNEAGHPGCRLFTTGVSAGHALEVQPTAADGTLVADAFFDSINVFKPRETGAQVAHRIGLANDAGTNPPVRGCYFEKQLADTNWFFVCRESGAETRVDTGVAHAAGQWYVGRIKRVSATEVGWALTSGLVVPAFSLVSTNLPSGLNEMRPILYVRTNDAAQKGMRWDYVDLVLHLGVNR